MIGPQAQAILAEVARLDAEVGNAAERWNGAGYKLQQISDRLTQAQAGVQELPHQRRRAERRLARARTAQATVVRQRAAEKAAIEAKLAERMRLLASVKHEVRRFGGR